MVFQAFVPLDDILRRQQDLDAMLEDRCESTSGGRRHGPLSHCQRMDLRTASPSAVGDRMGRNGSTGLLGTRDRFDRLAAWRFLDKEAISTSWLLIALSGPGRRTRVAQFREIRAGTSSSPSREHCSSGRSGDLITAMTRTQNHPYVRDVDWASRKLVFR